MATTRRIRIGSSLARTSATFRVLLGTSIATALLLAGCGDHAADVRTETAPPPQTLDTEQVLMLAQTPSETSDPLPVDGGALVVADANDETSDPIPVT